ncbi:MAG: ATP-dependent Clp protease adaptor ClpS [Chitinophagales bacterium]|nr:ATP-dependent Clp protease adaptor ClpS [Chitinophagales bacterium]
MKSSVQTSPAGYTDLEEVVATEHKLIIHNDNYNTFDWVIETLMDICKHTQHQAEQCALIIHNKGKYAVKQGNYTKLLPLKDAIAERGINVTIE